MTMILRYDKKKSERSRLMGRRYF